MPLKKKPFLLWNAAWWRFTAILCQMWKSRRGSICDKLPPTTAASNLSPIADSRSRSAENWRSSRVRQSRAYDRNSTGKTEPFVGLHVMLPSQFARRKLQLKLQSAHVTGVNSLGVTHSERRWSLAHPPVFCLFCTLSSERGHVPAPSVYSIKSAFFSFLSPLIRRLEGRDVSLPPWPLLGFCSFPSRCLGKNPTKLVLALEPALSPALTLSSSHRNPIVSPLPPDLISPYKVSLGSFFTT